MTGTDDFGLDDVELPMVDDYPAVQPIKYIGPPGVGKTWKKIKRLAINIEEKDLDASDVAFVTYRKSLADDICDRLHSEGLIDHRNPPTIGTLHAVILSLIGGLPEDVEFVTEEDKIDFCENHLNIPYTTQSPKDPDPGEKLLNYFQWCMKNRLSVKHGMESSRFEQVEEAFPRDRTLRLNGMLDEWTEYKERNNLIEYYSLLYKALEDNIVPDVEVLVLDEMHDAYPLFFAVCDMWLEELEDDAVCIVSGDPYQVVNQHEGADPKFFESIDIKEVTLPYSYRVPERLWNYGQRIISQEYEPRDTEPVQDGGVIEDIRVNPMQSNYGDWKIPSGRHHPATLVEDRMWEDGEMVDSMLVLARTGNQLKGIAEALNEQDIPYSGPHSNWFQRPSVAQNIGHLYDLYSGLSKVLQAIDQHEGEFTTNLTETMVAYTEFGENDDMEMTREEVMRLVRHAPEKYFINSTRTEQMEKARNCFNPTLKDFAALVNNQYFIDLEKNLGNFEFKDLGFEKERLLYSAINRDGTFYPPVQLRTIHASKGLEAETVILYDGITRSTRESMQVNPQARLNECRVWYVGVTRSSNRLTIVRNGFDYTDPSPYLPQVEQTQQPAQADKQADNQTQPTEQ